MSFYNGNEIGIKERVALECCIDAAKENAIRDYVNQMQFDNEMVINMIESKLMSQINTAIVVDSFSLERNQLKCETIMALKIKVSL